MICIVNKKKAMREIKRAWDAHQRMNLGDYSSEFARLADIEQFAEAMANISIMFGIYNPAPPCDWPET